MRAEDIESAIAQLDQTFPEGAAEKFAALISELERWNQRTNLTAIREPRAMVSAHLLDSLDARPL